MSLNRQTHVAYLEPVGDRLRRRRRRIVDHYRFFGLRHFEDSLLQRDEHRIAAAMRSEPAEDLLDVVFHREWTHSQDLADIHVRLALEDPLEDLLLARRQAFSHLINPRRMPQATAAARLFVPVSVMMSCT